MGQNWQLTSARPPCIVRAVSEREIEKAKAMEPKAFKNHLKLFGICSSRMLFGKITKYDKQTWKYLSRSGLPLED